MGSCECLTKRMYLSMGLPAMSTAACITVRMQSLLVYQIRNVNIGTLPSMLPISSMVRSPTSAGTCWYKVRWSRPVGDFWRPTIRLQATGQRLWPTNRLYFFIGCNQHQTKSDRSRPTKKKVCWSQPIATNRIFFLVVTGRRPTGIFFEHKTLIT